MDTPSFQSVVDRFYDPLFRFALSLTRGEADAQDLTQDTFVRWMERHAQIRDPSKTKSWLFTTMYRLFLNGARRQRRVTPTPLHLLTQHQPSLTVPTTAARNCEASGVVEILANMDETHRIPLTLFYLRQHTYQEIAEIMDLPMGTVMSRLSRGRDSLRERLEVATS